MSKRKALSATQLEDAGRLKKLFKQNAKLSQEKFAQEFGIGTTQGAVWQYLAGKIPLNLAVLIKFARGLRVDPIEISPTLAQLLSTAPGQAHEVREPLTLYPIEGEIQSRILKAFSLLTPDQREDFLSSVEAAAAANFDVISKYVKNIRGVTKERAADRLPAAPHFEKTK